MTKTDDHDFDAVIALGSNIGDKFANMAKAMEHLDGHSEIKVLKRSRNFKTPPWGKTDQDWFANAVITIATALSPHDLLHVCQAIEKDLGRVVVEKWGPRVIDLDILVYQDVELTDDRLVLPHPYITERGFVLAPFADVAPNYQLKGQSIRRWLASADCTGIEAVELDQAPDRSAKKTPQTQS